jgi:hypothetical protein
VDAQPDDGFYETYFYKYSDLYQLLGLYYAGADIQ